MTRISRTATTLPALAAALALLLASCGEDAPAASPDPSDPTSTPSEEPSSSGGDISADDYDPSRFDETSATIDHSHHPLTPGTRLDYVGTSLEDGERLNHTVTVIATDLTKVIDGVETLVLYERDFTEGELVEAELAMFAQDTDGHVWHFGQYPEEYEEGEVVATPGWLHGYEGATAGVLLPASPEVGTSDFAQGFAPEPINWVDRGRVYATGEQTCVPAGCYEDVVVIEEFETGLPEAFQDKSYAPGVGVVRVGWRGAKDENKEVLELTQTRQLGDAALEKAHAEARELEDRAYERLPDVFGETERMTDPAE